MQPINPLRNDNKLKLGVFAFNGDAAANALVPERYEFNWENSLDVAVQADAARYEAIVPYARWRSFVDAEHPSGFAFETFSWAAAVAARTRHACVMSTCHITTAHPLVVAKAVSTIDHISGGRFALNIVCGWFKPEIEMFGVPMLDADDRYAYADEWTTALKRLWTESDFFDMEGRFVTLRSGMSQPKPVQKPHPILMNAGGSPQGQNFVAKHCDIAFVRTDSYDKTVAEIKAYRDFARARYDREIQVWANCAVIQGDTDEDARRFADYLIQNSDQAFIEGQLAQRQRNLSPEALKALKVKFAMGGPAHVLLGSPQTIATELAKLSSVGIDGTLLSWLDFQNGVRAFNTQVLPILEDMGLRAAVN
ncbi:LLM class flavin-dependent oxidoreductase [Sinorhizobium meliloti]|uniref:Luciferase-like domain-containing protein n=1 Tax=Rhizobium meliloti TaxID=382 RepID=A0A2J0YU43_RHIML|nr:LLM class flavin-dependent oxidoreductase [Sinorhizobium meliloti]PJR09924.1 hypothetical protein CEJ86_30395 [Sinorhizobium meliloti]